MTKHDRYYQLMSDQNVDLLARFDQIHHQFQTQANPEVAAQFHAVGRDVRDLIYSWERRLCAGMERGVHGQYSQGVSQKFWDLVRRRYPLIDQVGLIIKKAG